MEVWIGTVPHTSEEQYREMPQVFVCNEKNLNVEIERRCPMCYRGHKTSHVRKQCGLRIESSEEFNEMPQEEMKKEDKEESQKEMREKKETER